MRELHVVGAAIVRDGRCLVARRGPRMSLSGKWEFPGGKVEDGEAPQVALARELSEELGVSACIGGFVGCGTATISTTRIQLDVYAATLAAGEPEPKEHSELRWLRPEELDALDWAEADIPIVPHVRALLAS